MNKDYYDNKSRFNVALTNNARDTAVSEFLTDCGGKMSKIVSLAIFEFMQTYGFVDEKDTKEKIKFLLNNYEYMYTLTHRGTLPVPPIPEEDETEKKPKKAAKKEPEEAELTIPDSNDMVFSSEDKEQAARLMAAFGIDTK